MRFCNLYCKDFRHNHCVAFCNGLRHEGSFYCEYHCDKLEHGHCIDRFCEEVPEIGENLCKSHCLSKNHKHCSKNLCDKPAYFLSSRCLSHINFIDKTFNSLVGVFIETKNRFFGRKILTIEF